MLVLILQKRTESVLYLTQFIPFSNPNTLFRANSLATKGVDELMKMIGRPYLRRVLKPSLDTVIFQEFLSVLVL